MVTTSSLKRFFCYFWGENSINSSLDQRDSSLEVFVRYRDAGILSPKGLLCWPAKKANEWVVVLSVFGESGLQPSVWRVQHVMLGHLLMDVHNNNKQILLCFFRRKHHQGGRTITTVLWQWHGQITYPGENSCKFSKHCSALVKVKCIYCKYHFYCGKATECLYHNIFFSFPIFFLLLLNLCLLSCYDMLKGPIHRAPYHSPTSPKHH